MMPTASAVVADIIDVALGNSANTFRQLRVRPRDQIQDLITQVDDCVSRFYIRILAKDQPGVMATLTRILGDHNISISGALQHEGYGPEETVPLVMVTHETEEKNMAGAIREFTSLDIIKGEPACIRIVDIPEDKD